MYDCLIIIDRDGTLIENEHYLGKENDWKKKIKFIDKTLFLLKALDVIFERNLKIVFTNQTGVARGYFSEEKVIEINDLIKKKLEKRGLNIHHWIFSPEADIEYAKKNDIQLNDYVKIVSSRKPNPTLLLQKLISLGFSITSFNAILVIGDSEEDKKLAENIHAKFIKI